MGESGRTSATCEFWHCRQCGTPNPSRPYLTHCVGCGTVRSPGPAPATPRKADPAARVPGGGVRAWIGRGSGLATWLWAVVVLVVLTLIRWVGDGWWGVTVLLFLPRWLFLTPWPVLAIASGVARRPRQWLVQGVVAIVVAVPLMLISLPVRQLWSSSARGFRVRIMTYNQGPYPIDADRLIRMIEEERIDLICFQEGKVGGNAVLDAYFASHGWSRDRDRQYLASRYPIVSEMPVPNGTPAMPERYPVILVRARVRVAPGVEFGLVSVHMPTLRFGLYKIMQHDVDGLKEHIAWWNREIERFVDGLDEIRDVPYLIGGDFNVPPDQASMAALTRFLHFAYEDSGWGYGYTRPTRYPWFRIDHILGSPEWTFVRSWVGPDFGSDHLPLIAEAVLPVPGPPPR